MNDWVEVYLPRVTLHNNIKIFVISITYLVFLAYGTTKKTRKVGDIYMKIYVSFVNNI